MVYCLEEADNGKDLHLLTVFCDKEARLSDEEIAGEPVVTVTLHGRRVLSSAFTDGLYSAAVEPEYEDIQLRFVPYYVWGNRGENEMRVWVRRAGG